MEEPAARNQNDPGLSLPCEPEKMEQSSPPVVWEDAAMVVHLILALFWFCFALGFLFLYWFYPESPWGGSSLWIGLAGLGAAAIKLLRWRMSARAFRSRQQAQEIERQWRQRQLEERRHERVPDPTFRFTDETPPNGRV
jgi:hypothetical protein